jgi:hypothetical protein
VLFSLRQLYLFFGSILSTLNTEEYWGTISEEEDAAYLRLENSIAHQLTVDRWENIDPLLATDCDAEHLNVHSAHCGVRKSHRHSPPIQRICTLQPQSLSTSTYGTRPVPPWTTSSHRRAFLRVSCLSSNPRMVTVRAGVVPLQLLLFTSLALGHCL